LSINKNEIVKDKIYTYGYIAHSVWLKGLHLLLESWKICNFSSTNTNLIIAGNIEKDLLKYLKQKKLLDKVQLIGEVKNIEQFYKSIDILIVPSIADNHPATITESINYDVPVICTNTSGSSVLIDDEINGIIIEPSIESITSALMKINENDKLRLILKNGIKKLNKKIQVINPEMDKNIFNEVLKNLIEKNENSFIG
jgi:glycosyltransferase involved in cell wall biosynthesis